MQIPSSSCSGNVNERNKFLRHCLKFEVSLNQAVEIRCYVEKQVQNRISNFGSKCLTVV